MTARVVFLFLSAATAAGSHPVLRTTLQLGDVPAWPPVCNLTANGLQPAVDAQAAFNAANDNCLSQFSQCLAANRTSGCLGLCDAALAVLHDGCYAGGGTYCRITGFWRGSAVLPAYQFESAQCVPSGCSSDVHDALQDAWRGAMCGDPAWMDPACALSLGCNYDLPSSSVWVIVGASVGAVLACFGTLAVCHWWTKRSRGSDDDDDDDDDEDDARDAFAALGAEGSDSATPPRAQDPVRAAAEARLAAYGGAGPAATGNADALAPGHTHADGGDGSAAVSDRESLIGGGRR